MKVNFSVNVEFSDQKEKETIQDFLDELSANCRNAQCDRCALREFCTDNCSSTDLETFATNLREILGI